MSKRRRREPSQLVVACFGRHAAALDWAQEQLSATYGPIAAQSPDYDFHHTEYYVQTMGLGLKKRLLVFDELRAPSGLAEIKNFTIGLEAALASCGGYLETRPLNLDPGLLQLGKFVLATTKDQSHRIYLGQGIFAENTLRFQGGHFVPWPWTYADYREPTVLEFLETARGAQHTRILQLQRAADNMSKS